MPGAPQTYQRQLQEVQNAYEEDMALLGQAGEHNVVTVDNKGQVTWTPESAAKTAPAPAAPAPPATSVKPVPRPPNATHTVRSKADNHMHWTNAQGTVDLGVAQ
jgi:hypothetical protein